VPRQARPSRDTARSPTPDAPRAIATAAASSNVPAARPCPSALFTGRLASVPQYARAAPGTFQGKMTATCAAICRRRCYARMRPPACTLLRRRQRGGTQLLGASEDHAGHPPGAAPDLPPAGWDRGPTGGGRPQRCRTRRPAGAVNVALTGQEIIMRRAFQWHRAAWRKDDAARQVSAVYRPEPPDAVGSCWPCARGVVQS
jgi:hypothetical protein